MLRPDGSWDCQLRLFLSVDIAGSTKYKNSRLDSDDYPSFWKDLFFKLYQEFHSLLISDISQARRDHTLARKIESSKTIGDEIVFSAHIADETDVYDIISGFLKALRDYDTEVMGYYPVRIRAPCLISEARCSSLCFALAGRAHPRPWPRPRAAAKSGVPQSLTQKVVALFEVP